MSRNTANQLLLSRGGPPSIRLTSIDERLTVNRTWFPCGEAIFLLVLTLLVGGYITIMGGVAALGFWLFVRDGSGWALLVAVGLGVASVPGAWGFVVLQGLFLPFKVVVEGDRYRLANGLLRLSLNIRPQDAEVVIYPAHSRGDWGCGARMRLKKGNILSLPFIPKCVIGTKYEALQEARRICQWLQENSAIGQVVLSKWGDTEQIKPRIDYIR